MVLFRLFIIFLLASLTFTIDSAFAQTGPGGIGKDTSITFWLDASDIDQTHGSDVSLWKDKSANGYEFGSVPLTDYNYTTTSSISPLPLNVPSLLIENGVRSVHFKEANFEALQSNGNSAAGIRNIGPDRFSILAVFRTNDKDYGLINYQRSRSDKTLFYGTEDGGYGDQVFVLNKYSESFSWPAVEAGKASIQMVTWENTNGDNYAYSNGKEVLAGSSLAETQSIAKYGKLYLGIAPTNSGSTNNAMKLFDGDIYEMILFSESINYGQRIILNNYIMAKYPNLGISIEKEQNIFGYFPRFKHDFIGVGRSTTDQDHLHSKAGGLSIKLPRLVPTSTIMELDNYEFVMAAHNNLTGIIYDRQSDINLNIDNILARYWQFVIKERSTKEAVTATLDFNLKEITGTNVTPGKATDYVLLWRNTYVDPRRAPLKIVAAAASVELPSTVRFKVNFDDIEKKGGKNTPNGEYFLATHDAVNSPLIGEKIWYSLSDGDWNDPNTWTLDGSGQNFQNPLLETPQKQDSVVITQKVLIPTGTNNISILGLNLLGSLDIGETTGHNFRSISGDGNLTVQGSSGTDNFPVADYTNFIDQNTGGTVYIKGSGFTTNSAKTFRNLIIDLDSNTDEFVLLHDLNLNGSLQIIKGKLKINDDAAIKRINIEVSKDLTVDTDGGLTVGTGNVYTSAAQSTIGDWHKAHHMLTLNGDFINDGVVRLTNQNKPVYLSESTTGAVTLVMQGATDNVLMANSTTDLYKFVVNKGTDKTHKLTVSVSDAKNFVLYGPNNLGFREETTGEFFKNPENRKALWIKRGSLVLEDQVYIPSLTEAGSDFVIGEDAALILNGADVKVFSTNYDDGDNTVIAENEADYSIFDTAPDINSDGANVGISVLGLLQIDDGEYNSGNSSGIKYLDNASGLVMLNGGTLNVTQIVDESTIGSLIINGGQLRLRDKGQDDKNFGIFSLSPNTQFTFTDGEIVIASVSNIDDIPDVDIQPSSGNYLVTGGKLVIEIDNYDDPSQVLGQVPVHLNITPNLFDLEVRKGRAILLNDLQVNNDVVIAGDSTDPPSLDLNTTNTLEIKGDLTVGVINGVEAKGHLYSRAGILKLSGTADQLLTYFDTSDVAAFSLEPIAPTAIDPKLGINHLIINKATGEVDLVPIDVKAFYIQSHLEILAGVVNANDIAQAVYINGDLTSNGTFNGQLVVGNDIDHLFTLGSEVRFIGSIQTNLIGKILVDGTLTVENLIMNGGVIDMGDDQITVNTLTSSSGSTSFSDANMITFSGKASAKGLRMNNTAGASSLTFPIGVNEGGTARYTGAKTIFTSPYTGGVTVTPIATALSTLNPSGMGNKLDFYWKVKYESAVSNTVDFEATYSIDDFFGSSNPSIVTVDDMVAGRVVDQGVDIGKREVFNTVSVNANPVTFGEASQVDASYTIADDSYFDGMALSFYSRSDGTVVGRTIKWSDPSSWSNDMIDGSTVATRFPVAGDLVFIGSNHIVQVNSASNEASKITFEHDAVSFPNKDSYPRIEVLNSTQSGVQTTLKFDDIEGTGFISLDVSDSPTSPVIDADLSAFLADPYNIFQYNIVGDGATSANLFLGKTYSTYPTLILNQKIVTQDNYFNLDNSLTILKDMEILGNLNVRLFDTAQPNTIEVENDLLIGQTTEGGHLLFTSDGTNKFDFIVKGDVDLTRGTSGTSILNSRTIGLDGTNAGPVVVVHEFHAYQDVKLGDGSLDFYVPNSNKIAFHAIGAGNHELSSSSTAAGTTLASRDFYTINIEKGTSVTNSFRIDADFTLNGPTDGLSNEKALQLTKGTLYVNAPSSMIPLSTGGSDFTIGNNTGLILEAGLYDVSGANNGIYLDGILQIEGAILYIVGSANENNYIEYSSTGDAELNIKGGELWVNTQIRRSLSNAGGILKYDQEGGDVTLGLSTASDNSRGVLEILNTGSSFRHDAGTITIVNGNGSTTGTAPLVPALILTPDTFVDPTTNTGMIALGTIDTQSNSNNLDYNILPPIGGIRFGAIGGVSNQLVNDLEVTKSGIEISGNGAADNEKHSVIVANNNIRFTGNFINAGSLDMSSKPELRLESVVPSGETSLISTTSTGSFNISNLVKEGGGTLEIHDNDLSINHDLEILDGILAGNGNTINVGGNIINDGIHTSSNNGGIVMKPFVAGTSQTITISSQNGTAVFGKLTIDNPAGVSIPTDKYIDITVNDDLDLSSGVFDIGTSLLTLNDNVNINAIKGNGFSKDLMIRVSSGSTVSNPSGLRKIFDFSKTVPGGVSYLWPFGVEEYTPAMVKFNYIEGTAFSITMRPVNQLHPSIQQDSENPDPELDDFNNVLQYYWETKSDGIGLFDIDYTFTYNPNDAYVGSSSYTLADYRGTRFTYNDLKYSKSRTDNFDEANNTITFNIASIAGANDADFESDYTAGVDPILVQAAIPPGAVPEYVSNASGNWDDPFIWTPKPPKGGPQNAKVTIASRTEVKLSDNMDDPDLVLMTIEEGAVLHIGANDPLSFGHIVGTGTIRSKNGTLPEQGLNLEKGLVNFYSCEGGTIELYGNSDYAIDNVFTEISALTIEGRGTKNFSRRDIRICNDLNIDEGTVKNPFASSISIGGDLKIKSGANLQMAYNIRSSQVGKLIFDGDSPQIFSGVVDDGPSSFVHDLVLNNPAGLTKTGGNVLVSKAVRLINGVISTSDGSLISLQERANVYGGLIDNLPFEGALADPATNKTHRYINGPLEKRIDATNYDSYNFVFPIGDDGDLGQLKIKPISGSDKYIATYFSENPHTALNGNLEANSNLDHISYVEYWSIKSLITASTTANGDEGKALVSLYYDSNSDVSIPEELRVAEWDSGASEWKASYKGNGEGVPIPQPTDPVLGQNSYLGFVPESGFSVDKSVLIDLSLDTFVTIGTITSENKLPIKLVSFTGKLNKQGVQLEWATSSEVNNDYFVIERTIDGETFEILDTVDSKGNGNILTSYEFIDELPKIGNNYYRLKQVDFDGTSTYSGLVLVAYKPVFKPLEVSIYPNPINNKRFELLARKGNYQQDISLQLMDIYGNIVFDMSYDASITNVTQKVKLHKDIKSGIYIANILQGDRLIQKRVIIK